MIKELDARGLACPAPVLLVKDAIEGGDLLELTVIVDNEASRENVTRFLGTKNYTVSMSYEGGDFRLLARHTGESATAQAEKVPLAEGGEERQQKTFMMIATDRLGAGDDELGEKLMISFLKTIKEMGEGLWRLVMVNSGVKLATRSSPVLAELQAYEQAGLVILVCGTCLAHFGLIEAKKVGQTTNMLDIVTAMQMADKVINIG